MADNKTIPADKYGVTILAVTIAEDYLQSGTMPAPVTDEVLEREQAAGLPLTVLTTDKAMEKEGTQVMHGRTLALDDAPELDPSNPQYNPQAYSKRLQELAADITETKATLYAGAATAAGAALRHIMGGLDSLMPKAETIINALPEIVKSLQDALKNLAGIDWELLPYISKELEKPENKELVEKCGTIKDLTKAPEWQAILEAARQTKAEAEQKDFLTARKVDTHPVLTDKEMKLPFNIFNGFINDNRGVDGQISMLPVKADHHYITTDKQTGKKRAVTKELTAFFSVKFSDALPPDIARMLTPTDRLVYGAVYALSEQSPLMSIAQIGRAMGYKGALTEKKKQEIWKSLEKMGCAFIWYDFHEERAYYTGSDGYEDIGIKGRAGENLLMFKARKDVIINGVKTDDAILLLSRPILYTVAMQRNYRVAKVPIECLQLPGKMQRDDKTIAMMFYLLERIDDIKNPKKETTNKILYKSIYEACGIDTNKGTNAARKKLFDFNSKMFAYLDHLKNIKYIKGYQEETTKSTGDVGIKILF